MNLKDTLLATSFELFLKYGIKSVSMDDISKKLGISKKTIYGCVDTKENLIIDIIEKHIHRDQTDILKILKSSEDAVAEMVNITRHVLIFLRKMTPSLIYDLKKYHPHAWHKMETSHIEFIQQTIFTNLVRGQKEGLYRNDFDPLIISMLYVHKSMTITDQDKFPLDKFERVNLFKEMVTYHLHGIVSEEGRDKLVKSDF
ncbi:MAG: TetR/AcrR family transcriptional regulator [Saprospiraceae bacterium]